MCRPYHGKSAALRWHLIVEARIRFLISQCKDCSGRSGVRTGFVLRASVLPCQHLSSPSKPSFTYILTLAEGQHFLSLFNFLV
jgi:hypothetical protein